MSQELMNNRQRKGGAHILWSYMAWKSAEGIGVWCKEQRESRLIRAEKSVQFVGMYLAWVRFGWDTRETDRQSKFLCSC